MASVCGIKRSYLDEDNEAQTTHLLKKPCYPTLQPIPSQTNSSHERNQPQTGSEWVELLVKEMLGATSLDDAKSRAEKVLEELEKRIRAHAREETLKSVAQEKEKAVEVLSKENCVLRKAVAIQHEKCKEFEGKEEEMKRLVCGYEERLKTLEVKNYALSMHLNQALKGDSLHGFYNRHVF